MRNRRARNRSLLLAFCVLIAGLTFSTATALALTYHKFESQITEVPASSGAPVTGGLNYFNALTVDEAEGRLWLADEGLDRAIPDSFNASSGAFVEQLPQSQSASGRGGLAIGHRTGEREVYVVNGGVVQVFGPSGALQATWTGADTPSGSFGEIFGLAVNESTAPGDWASGDVLVKAGGVIDVFEPQPGGGEKYVTQFSLPSAASAENQIKFVDIAVSRFNGDLFASSVESGRVDVFEPTALDTYSYARELTAPDGGPVFLGSMAVDGSNGDVYGVTALISNGEISEYVVYEYNAAGVFLGVIKASDTPLGTFRNYPLVAVDPASGHVFVSVRTTETWGTGLVDVFGPNVVVPDVVTEPVSNLKPTSAVLHGTVNPDNAGQAECWFAWGATPSFGSKAPCSTTVPNGPAPVAVHARLEGLEADTTYYYRLAASNQNGQNLGEAFQDVQFTTPGPGLRGGQWASGVASRSARLNADIDPHGAPTSYYFQYSSSDTEACGEGTSSCSVFPSSPVSLGSGEGVAHAEQLLEGLAPSTVYHYRLVVESEWAPGQVQVFYEPDHTFTTQSVGTPFALPDGRQWELVSPSDSHGAQAKGIGETGIVEAAAAGSAFTYLTTLPTEGDPAGYAEGQQVLAYRGVGGGWSSQDIISSYSKPAGLPVGNGRSYRYFSEDLSQGVEELLAPFSVPQREGVSEVFPPVTERTPYLRHDATCAQSPRTCFEPLVTEAEGYADVPAGTKLDPEPNKQQGPVRFVGATPDASKVILKAGWLYEWSSSMPYSKRLQLVSILPQDEGGEPVPGHIPDFGARTVSKDGTRIVFEDEGGAVSHLYMRDTVAGQTIRLDLAESGLPASGAGATFQGASADDSRVFFATSGHLVKGAGVSGEDLYECRIVVEQVAGSPVDKCELTDLTLPLAAGQPGEGESAEVLVNNHGQHIPGVSEDGNYVYFIAHGVQAQGATAGAPNLYVRHEGMTSFIATLSANDFKDWNDSGGGGGSPSTVPVRVSPDGSWLTFMSQRSLTGYDNEDVTSVSPGERLDAEVFLYHAPTGRLICASCNPTGARPAGRSEPESSLAGGFRLWGGWVAANIPGWTDYNVSTGLYQSRYLSNAGRLFYNSSDALVPQDTNGNEDVYEYEPAGVGSCRSGSSTFAHGAGGCVGLISSGVARGESAFGDASETGGDVFFLSGEDLAPGAQGSNIKVYDAHECTSSSPCPALPPVGALPCTTAEACRAAPIPQPAVFGAPPSATFEGQGNVSPVTVFVGRKAQSKKKRCAKGQRLRRGKCVKARSIARRARKAIHKRGRNGR